MRLAVDLHTHTVASTGGELTEQQLIDAAAGAGVDVLGITEHSRTADGPELPGEPSVTRTPVFASRPLVVRGRELTQGPGHRVVLDGGPAIVAHPFAPYPNGSAAAPPARGELLEVWNGPWRSDRPWQADNEAALAWWSELLASARPPEPLPIAIGNSDTHLAGQIGTPCTVVEVERPSIVSALAAVARGESWIVAGAHLTVGLTVRRTAASAGPGRVLVGRGPVSVAVTVAGAGGCRVTLHDRDGVIAARRVEHDGVQLWQVDPTALLRVEIRDPTGDMLAVSNPVRLASCGEGPDGLTAPGNEVVAGRGAAAPTAR